MNLKTGLTLSSLLLFIPNMAFAHTDMSHSTSFFHGFNHPIGGMDHLLAMLAVGMLAAQLKGRALWTIPTTFIVLMALGGAIGLSGIQLPFIEQGIIASVITFGVLIATGLKLSVNFSAVLVGFFAIFHGYAHGIEMPVSTSSLTYSVGFLLATALLHSIAIIGTTSLQKINHENINRVIGSAIALSGFYLAV